MSKIKHSLSENQARPAYNITIDRWNRALLMSRESKLCAGDRLVALALLHFANRIDFDQVRLLRSWPSQERLAKILGRHPVNITKSLKRLVGCRVLEIDRQGGGRGSTTRYRWNFDWLNEIEADLGIDLQLWSGRNPSASAGVKVRETPASAQINPSVHASETPAPTLHKLDEDSFDHLVEEKRAQEEGRFFEVREDTSCKKEKSNITYKHSPAKALLALKRWAPSLETVAEVSEHCGSIVDPAGTHHAEKFRQYHLSNGKAPDNLDAAFLFWMLREQEYSKRVLYSRPHRGNPLVDAALDLVKNHH